MTILVNNKPTASRRATAGSFCLIHEFDQIWVLVGRKERVLTIASFLARYSGSLLDEIDREVARWAAAS